MRIFYSNMFLKNVTFIDKSTRPKLNTISWFFYFKIYLKLFLKRILEDPLFLLTIFRITFKKVLVLIK